MNDQKNTIIAIVLSAIVLIGWEYFYALPQKQRQEELQRQAQTTQVQPAPQAMPGQAPGAAPVAPGAAPQVPAQPGATAPVEQKSRESVIRSTERVTIDTPLVKGSISLKGGRIDDLSLAQYHDTVDPSSPAVVLLSPSGSPHPFYAEFGWVSANVKTAGPDTVWLQEGSGSLAPNRPVVLVYDNGDGLVFRRTIAIDEKYLITVKDEVANTGRAAVTLSPYALLSRHGTPPTSGYGILHEGPIGVLGKDLCLRQSSFGLYTACHEESYKVLEDKKSISFMVKSAWFGFTDKYWAAVLLPDTGAELQGRFTANVLDNLKTYQADYLLNSQTVAPGGTGSADGRLFAGPKEVRLVNDYDQALNLNRFELLIDWGLFYFITKPMFWSLDYIYGVVGNFGVAILLVTVLLKGLFFPLANKSYASMAKMKAVQPQMQALRERYPDDKVKQQQELMELYRREKINPVAGCLPIVIQIPVFFALYKVLFVTIEMRHAPFFGWIRDLSAPDPTNVFTLFGLLPYDPSHLPLIGGFLVLGVWPLIMGVTMWFQMKLNPAPPDPAQKIMFDWMPVIFTFMLASFSSGLVIYWAWNNTLSVIQQSIIMRRNGVKVELLGNLKDAGRGIKGLFGRITDLFKKKSNAGMSGPA